METRTIPCSCPGCDKAAIYKIAARWSDGRFSELKTYALSCLDHFGPLYRRAIDQRSTYTQAPHEILGEVGIYRCGKGLKSDPSVRLRMLEDRSGSMDRLGKLPRRIGSI
ncbi:hypothetical protein [Singulisphaera sp. PoT]|uniref:hypothetical protein n=1 Tax=Singulisphaera sp. PoT TaxID=3411797 RepID=UPI003BF4E7F7